MKKKLVIFELFILFLLCLVLIAWKNYPITISADMVPQSEESQNENLQNADPEPVIEVVYPEAENYIVCIDAGHQQRADMGKEPIGPGATKTKAKVDGGTLGKNTGLTEYQLNLDIALKLQSELEDRGYAVVMVRTTNDVNISNSERAQIANEAKVDAFVKIHADGCDDTSVHGASAVCQTADNPYNGNLYEDSRRLSECVLDGEESATGCKKRHIIEDDSMTGINWSQVPTTIIEVGYLTNKAEEAKLSTDDYQQLVAQGIADGIDEYFRTDE